MFLGFAGGIAVGAGVIALFIVLDMIPRLAQITRTFDKVHWYEGAMVSGSFIGTIADFWNWKIAGPWLFSGVVGLFNGIFIGMLAAALTEVLNVLPIIAKRLHMQRYLFGLLLAMVFGKVAGSLFEWFIYNP
ncbi:stage V sporulation protein AB [Paenibacillus motobuensis]|uniref:Stage V sporulation protein AB n=1 Tax=Paenibacillus lutimineralis TaxID=2707005 RepID=A0A3Q9IHL8_9BACL|nr:MULTISPECIES: stage V sporulation protein AB [Paenibacillus]AZS18223.1 stage V sporulation protein AB [Paenibacillus lutimineralis]MCM3040205.1 stage V sporulation protein AB [Paenibacillus lutimineralis]MCM3647309.1 stage V sporulation protein AB [Paenibacillus motobuensis]